MLIKKVNIYPTMPITALNPVIRVATKNVLKSVEEIRTCINARAMVEEILMDGSTLKLNLSNYDKDNNKIKEATPNDSKSIVEDDKKEEKPSEDSKQDDQSDNASEDADEAKTETSVEDNPSGEEAHALFENEAYDAVDPEDEEVELTPDDEKGL